VAVAVALLVTVVALVAKPWAGAAGPGGATPSDGHVAAEPVSPVLSSPRSWAPGAEGGSPSGTDADPGRAIVPRDPTDGVWAADGVSATPVDPTTWSDISRTLGTIDRYGLAFVARWPGGLYWGFVPVGPEAGTSTVAPWPARSPATRPFGAVPADAVRITGHLARPVAIGITRPSGERLVIVRGWWVLGPAAEVRLPLRHPVGDLGRYLFMGPGLGIPRGEQRNRRLISAWPPSWLPGTYRFDLSTDAGNRSIVVVLEPDGDPTAVPPEALAGVDVLATVIGGVTEHCAPGAEALCPTG
jgi:hypothetical protein